MRQKDPLFLILLAAYIVYAGLWIMHGAFTLGGRYYVTLFDDAMISMRYARNLHDGFGLVWNPHGERVEGYTNFLWVVYMAALHALPVPPALMGLPVQMTNAALMVGVLVFARRLALLLTGNSRGAGLCAAALTAAYYSLSFWSWSGLETAATTFVLTVAAWLAARDICANRALSWPPLAWLGVGTFLRPDMAVPLVLLTLYGAWAQTGQARRGVLVRGLGLAAACVGVQTLARLAYYGVPLPNTYYLKMTGGPAWIRIGRGVWEMAKFTAEGFGLPVLAPYFAVKAAGGSVQKGRALLAVLWAGQFAYNVSTGGDAWEYWGHASRFVAQAVPLLMVMLACVVHDTRRAGGGRYGQFIGTLSAAYGGVIGSVSAAYGQRMGMDRTWVGHGYGRGGGRVAAWAAATAVLIVVMNVLYYPKMAREAGQIFDLHTRAAEMAAPDDDAAFVRAAQCVDSVSEPSATVAVMRAGITPYFAGRTTLDFLGKCDSYIAHEPTHRWTGGGRRTVTDFVPGHMKWDYAYTVNRLRPDIIADGFDVPGRQQLLGTEWVRLVAGNVTLHLRRSSPRVRWNVVKQMAARPGVSLTMEDGTPAAPL